jgi:hypothetical protein
MKKFAVILLITFVIVVVVSSCNKKTCPAYKNQLAYTEHIG